MLADTQSLRFFALIVAIGLATQVGARRCIAQDKRGSRVVQEPQTVASAGQSRPSEARPAVDSARVVRAARAAQERFERYRFQHFPWSHDRGGGGACDERLGRFCIWYEEDETTTRPPPPAEPPLVAADRDLLIGRLRSAAFQLPGDDWIVGQLVRYEVEAGHRGPALDDAAGCAATAWWCAALDGFARHAAGDFAAADSSFGVALAAMPDEMRRRWTDLGPLLEEGDARALRRHDADRDSVERRMWWLADPLWMVPGNERRTEHLSRHVLDRLQERARSTDGLAWGSDLRQLLLRFGWPVGWERIVPPYPRAEPPNVRTRYAPHGRHFLPPLAAAESLGALDYASWADARRSRTEYAPSYAANGFDALRTQIARFRRGDSVLVAAAWEIADDSVPPETRVDAALIVASGPQGPGGIVRDSAAHVRGVLSAMVAKATEGVVSVEAILPDQRRAARARMGLAPLADAAPLALSDLLLLDEADTLARGLAEALPLARGGARWKAGERVAVYWEIYRAAADSAAPLSLSLSFYELRRGLAARIARRIGLLGGPVDVALRWTEASSGSGTTPRAIALQLPALSPGSYELRLTVGTEGGPDVISARKVEVVK